MGMANGKDKTYYEIEIARVKAALEKTQSGYLKRDYTKYLKKLYMFWKIGTLGQHITKNWLLPLKFYWR